METLIFTFLFMLIIVAAMAIGVMFGRQPIKGSCGGIAQLGLSECEICGARPGSCMDEPAATSSTPPPFDSDRVVDATSKDA